MLMKLLTGLHVVYCFSWFQCLHHTALSLLLHELPNIFVFQIPELVLSLGSQLLMFGIITFLLRDRIFTITFIKT